MTGLLGGRDGGEETARGRKRSGLNQRAILLYWIIGSIEIGRNKPTIDPSIV